MVNKRGRPRINPNGVLKPVRGRIPEEDTELLEQLGYTVGQALREFCEFKRRTMLPLMSPEEAETMLKKEEEIQRESKSREQDLINELAIVNKIKAENESVKGDLNACRKLTVKRLEANKELFLKHGAGYKEVLRQCLSAMTEDRITFDEAIEFFDNYRARRRKPPKIGDIEGLIY